MKSFLKRLRNISLVFVLLIWQVVFAGAPLIQSSLAHAATIPSNSVGFSSVGFVLSGSYSVVNGQPTGAGQLKNGNVGAYPEGSCIPAQFNITNNDNTAGDTTISPIFDYYDNGVVGITQYEKVTTSLTGDPSASADNLNDFTFSGQPLGPGTTSYPTSAGGTVSATVSGVYGGNDAGTTATTSTDAFRHYNVVLSNIPAHTTVYMLLCARLGLDASQYPGSSLSMRTVQGGAENVPIPVNQLLSLPSITVNKTVSGGSAVPSDFSFDLSSDPNNGLGKHYTIASGQSSVTIPNVNPDGSYTITESEQSNYVFSSGTGTSCSIVQASLNTAAGQMTATVAAGTPDKTDKQGHIIQGTIVNATCNFTNTYQTGSIKVTKVVNNNNGGTAVVSNFPLYVNQTSVTSGATNSFPANQSYTISETQKTGYHQDSIACINTADNSPINNDFTLASNENVSCTITNSDIAPKLTLVKHVSGGTAVATDWTLSATPADNQYSTLSGSGGFSDQTARANEQYTLGESGGPSGYSAGSWSCDGGSLTSGNKLTLALADDVTCNITNTRDTGTLTVNKLLVPSNDSGLFNLSMTGPTSYTKNNQGNNGSTGTQTVDTGSYTVSETAGTNTSLSNYSSSYSCVDGQTTVASGNATTSDSFNVAKGQSIVCTFTNTRYGSISGFKYEVNADSSQVGALESWTIYLYDSQNNLIGTTTTDSLGNFVFSNLLAGSYTLGENLQTGWTQIYSPNGVTLTAGQNSTDNNFGNFQNAEISGMKFNDVNGNYQKDSGEGGLSGWTINLSKSDGHGGWTADGSTVTGNGGAYSFTDLAPGSYKLCETSQTGWTQTYPTTNSGCNLVDVVLSGHNYSDTNFGNQGQGTITVIKNVNDGFGNVTSDVTTWTWGYSGTLGSASGLSTGSTNHQSVAAGDYTVSENQKTGYHVTASSCTGESDTSVNTSKSVTVSPGEDVTCTFTNTRDTGTIDVVKNLLPSNDTGKFDLSIDGTTKANDVGNGGTTGAVTVVTGTHGVSETAGTSTSLNNYESSYVCTDNGRQVKSGDGTSISDINVGYGDEVVCTFTNTRHATLTIVKNVDDGFGNISTDVKTWTWGYDGVSYDDNLATGSNNSQELAAGDYSVWENQQSDYHFTSVSCSDGSANVSVTQSEQFDVTLDPGENLTCTFLNTRDTGTITVVKDLYPSNDPGKFNLQINGQNYATDVGDQGTTNAVTVVTGDNYNVSETAGTGTDLKNYQSRYWCTNEETYGDGTQSDNFSVGKDQNITCYFENYRLGINVVKTGPATAEPGQTVTYTFTVTNTGYLPLSGITVNDDIAGAGVYQSGDTNNDNMLETNETWIFTANYTIPKDQFNSVTNTVTACGTTGGIEQIEALDSQLNNSKTVCAQDSHTLVIPKVLAEVTPPQVLANTGQSAWAGVVAGLTMLSLVLGINIAFGRQAKKQR